MLVSSLVFLPSNEQPPYNTHENNVSKVMKSNTGWTDLDKHAKIARFHLNQEYREKALIKNKIIYRYYPAQTLPLMGHTHFDIEGKACYAAGGDIELKKIKNISTNQYRGLAHFQFPLHVTPKELESINNFLDSKTSIFPSTCTGNTATIIGKDTALQIPFPLSISPLLSGYYLQARKICGWNRVGKVTYMAENDNWNYLIRPLIGTMGELYTIRILGGIVTKIALNYLSKQPLIN